MHHKFFLLFQRLRLPRPFQGFDGPPDSFRVPRFRRSFTASRGSKLFPSFPRSSQVFSQIFDAFPRFFQGSQSSQDAKRAQAWQGMPCQGLFRSFDSFPGFLAVLWFLDFAGLSKALRVFKRGQSVPWFPGAPGEACQGPRFSGLFLGASRALLELPGCPSGRQLSQALSWFSDYQIFREAPPVLSDIQGLPRGY